MKFDSVTMNSSPLLQALVLSIALALITLVVLETHLSPDPQRITIIWLAAASQILALALGWSPFFLVVIGIAVWSLRTLRPRMFSAVLPSPGNASG